MHLPHFRVFAHFPAFLSTFQCYCLSKIKLFRINTQNNFITKVLFICSGSIKRFFFIKTLTEYSLQTRSFNDLYHLICRLSDSIKCSYVESGFILTRFLTFTLLVGLNFKQSWHGV